MGYAGMLVLRALLVKFWVFRNSSSVCLTNLYKYGTIYYQGLIFYNCDITYIPVSAARRRCPCNGTYFNVGWKSTHGFMFVFILYYYIFICCLRCIYKDNTDTRSKKYKKQKDENTSFIVWQIKSSVESYA